MQDRLKIGRLTVFQSRLKLDFLSGLNGRLIQSMTQTLNDALDTNLTGRSKYDLQQNFPFDFETTSLISVNRTGLERNLGRNRLSHGLGGLGFCG